MVANPDFFWIRIEIRISDYDPDLIRFLDLIRISDFRSGLKSGVQIMIRISIRFSDSDPNLIRISDKHAILIKKII
jgi:hypothetical protein